MFHSQVTSSRARPVKSELPAINKGLVLVYFNSKTTSSTHSHTLSCIVIHTFHTLMHSPNVNMFYLSYHDKYMYSFMRATIHGCTHTSPSHLCVNDNTCLLPYGFISHTWFHPQFTCSYPSIPSAQPSLFDHNFCFVSPNWTNGVSLES